MILLLAACSPAELAVLSDARTPEERLDAALPGLAALVARHTDALGPVADVVDHASPDLIRLLVPPKPGATWEDAPGDATGEDLRSARVELKGTTLTGSVTGVGLAEAGVGLWLDTRGGPAPDLRVRLTREGVRVARMDGYTFSPDEAIPGDVRFEGATVTFAVDLAVTGRLEEGHAGFATAVVEVDGRVDSAPAGPLGVADDDAVHTLVDLVVPKDPDAVVPAPGTTAGALARHAGDDANLTLAVALAYGALRPLVADEVEPLVVSDARARLAYGLALDPWLARHGADWRLAAVPPTAKLLWAWPAGENVVYGALPLAWETHALSRERYRYHAPGIESLAALRDDLPFEPVLDDAAQVRDDAVWEDMTYRAKDEGMAALCDAKALDQATCFRWEADRRAGESLGPVDGRPIALHEATSVALQVDRWEEEGDFIGDCTTATTLAMAALQAVGIVPLAVGYAGPDWYRPTHNQPLYFDGGRFVPTQGMPNASWDAEQAWVYAVLPPVGGPAALSLAWESEGWARGGSVPGATMAYGAITRSFLDGISPGVVSAWLGAPGAAEWPSFPAP